MSPVRSPRQSRGTPHLSISERGFAAKRCGITSNGVKRNLSQRDHFVKSSPTVIILLVLVLSVSCGKREKVSTAKKYFDRGAEYFKEKSFALGALEFQKVLEKHPKSKWADNAQFGLGLIYEELGDYQKAVEELGKVVTNYPKGDKASNALFGMGEIYERRLKNNSQAIDAYQKLVDDYPGSRWAPMARERIERLRKEGKR